MKKTIITILTVAFLLTACSQQEKVYRIAFSQCSSGQWREKVNREMLASQHLYDHNARVSIAIAGDDPALQIRQIDSLVDAGTDLLVVAPAESAPIAPAIARVRAKGIPVVFFDRKAETQDYTAFIGGDNEEAGRSVGSYAVTLAQETGARLKHKPMVLEVTGSLTTSPAQERHRGFASMMEGNDALDYVMMEGDWTSEKTSLLVKDQIAQGHCPDIVFCHNDGMATGAYQAVADAGMEGKVQILGIDGLPGEGLEYVREGHQRGTYVYPTHGDRIVKLALDILTGKDYERDNKLQGMMVTPENVELITLNSTELMEQQTDLVIIHDKLENYFGLYNVQHKMLIGSFVCIALLIVAALMALRAYIQTRKTIRQRQTMNEEQTLFYTDASHQKLHQLFDNPQDDLPEPNSQDMLFAQQLNEAIRRNMSNPNLKMDDLGDEMGLSRVQLYRKVKALTGQSPVELLRQMRLQRAYALLGSTTKTVAEIAFEVGFNTPGYFSKCFREQYGKLPMDLRASSSDK